MKKRTVALVCGVISVAFSQLCLADIEPVSVADPALAASVSGNGLSTPSEISPDGRFVVFSSLASNLATNDDNHYSDVFRRDRQLGTTLLISANPDGFSANGASGSPSVSTNGEWIAFQSDASDLVDGDTNGVTDIFVKNVTLGQTALVSVNTNGVSANDPSTSPIMTQDGRFVAFESTATDLVTNYAGKFVRCSNVYLRDLVNNTTLLVSVGTNGLSGTNGYGSSGDSSLSSVSADGRYVLFVSSARNLGAIINTVSEIFVRDMQAEKTYWIGTNVAPFLKKVPPISTTSVFSNPVMSGDGQVLAFRVTKDVNSLILRYDLASNSSTMVSSNKYIASVSSGITYNWDYAGPSISDDGSVIAYGLLPINIPPIPSIATNQIYVWTAAGNTNTPASMAPDGSTPGNANSDSPVISADGKTLAFLSAATNLVDNVSVGDHSRAYIRDLSSGITKLINVETNLDKPPGDVYEYPIISADGKFVVFSSTSDGLVNNDNNDEEDVFIRNTQDDTTELVSSKGAMMESSTADDISSIPAKGMSLDGRIVVFSTMANNVVGGDTNQCNDIFVRDMATGKSLLVSVNAEGTGPGNGHSMQPSISADGSLVAFQSDASDLVVGDTNGTPDVFLYHLASGKTMLVSGRYDGSGSTAGISDNPIITPDGRYVIFRSNAKDLTTNAYSDSSFKAYAYDVAAGVNHVLLVNNKPITDPTVQAISPDSRYAAVYGNNNSSSTGFSINDLSTQVGEGISNSSVQFNGPTAFSGNGRWVGFVSTVSSVNCNVVLRDLVAKTNLTLSAGKKVWSLSFNGDGSRVAYERFGTETMPTNKHQIFVYDALLSSNILVSANLTGTNGSNGDSRNPILSLDGRHVYFNSQATDLVGDADSNGLTDAFVRDLNSGTTRLLSVNQFKTGSGNSHSVLKGISADGQTLALESFASDLISMDMNMGKDVFVLRDSVSLADTDNDGLSDNWEMEYFGSLERDGTGDYDNDGVSDGAEYLAGTDPTNKQSALVVMEVGMANARGRLITWSAIPGKVYRVQYKTDLKEGAWTDLDGTVWAEAAVASKSDDTANGNDQRFYRVMLVP